MICLFVNNVQKLHDLILVSLLVVVKIVNQVLLYFVKIVRIRGNVVANPTVVFSMPVLIVLTTMKIGVSVIHVIKNHAMIAMKSIGVLCAQVNSVTIVNIQVGATIVQKVFVKIVDTPIFVTPVRIHSVMIANQWTTVTIVEMLGAEIAQKLGIANVAVIVFAKTVDL